MPAKSLIQKTPPPEFNVEIPHNTKSDFISVHEASIRAPD
jgi:hypothetical protein